MMFKVGTPVTGDDFIGREEYIRRVVRYMKDNKSMSVFGLARIGKSSIIDETIRRIETKQIVFEDSTPLFFKFSFTRDIKDRIHLFEELYLFLKKYIEENYSSIDIELMNSLSRISQDLEDDDISYQPFKQICVSIYRTKKRSLWLVLDEMDYVNESLGFYLDKIRELINSSEESVRVINISRHTLTSILPHDIPGSNYPGIISESINVVGYCDADLISFKQIAEESLSEISEYKWSEISHYSGNIPILLSESINILLDNPECTLEEYVEKFLFKTEKYFKYWFDSLYGMKLVEALRDYIENKNADNRLLRMYGVISDDKLALPYLKEYILAVDNNQEDTLFNDYIQLMPEIESLIDLGNSVYGRLIGFDDYSRKNLRSGLNDLSAMSIKIEYLKKIKTLSSFVRIDISIDEYNSFNQRRQEIQHLIGSISLR